MSFKLSTGLRNAILGKAATYSATSIAAVASGNKLTDTGNLLLSSGFRPGDLIEIAGFTGNTANNGLAQITSLTAGEMVISGKTLVDDAAGETVTITAQSKGIKDIFKNHVIRVYTGAAPADADAAETGTLLLKITKDHGAFTPGSPTNGLNFDAIVAGVMSKNADNHQGVGLADGTAGYYRIYDNAEQTGSSATAIRAQGVVGLSSQDFLMSSTVVTTSAVTTLGTHNLTMPTL